MDFIGTLGRGSVAGLLLGILIAVWVKPATTEGQLLLVLVTIAICVLLTAILRVLFFPKRPPNASDKDEP